MRVSSILFCILLAAAFAPRAVAQEFCYQEREDGVAPKKPQVRLYIDDAWARDLKYMKIPYKARFRVRLAAPFCDTLDGWRVEAAGAKIKATAGGEYIGVLDSLPAFSNDTTFGLPDLGDKAEELLAKGMNVTVEIEELRAAHEDGRTFPLETAPLERLFYFGIQKPERAGPVSPQNVNLSFAKDSVRLDWLLDAEPLSIMDSLPYGKNDELFFRVSPDFCVCKTEDKGAHQFRITGFKIVKKGPEGEEELWTAEPSEFAPEATVALPLRFLTQMEGNETLKLVLDGVERKNRKTGVVKSLGLSQTERVWRVLAFVTVSAQAPKQKGKTTYRIKH